MIYQTPDGNPLRSVSAALNFTVGAQGQPAGFPATTNRGGTGKGTTGKVQNVSTTFQEVDQLINHLDASFEQLPP